MGQVYAFQLTGRMLRKRTQLKNNEEDTGVIRFIRIC